MKATPRIVVRKNAAHPKLIIAVNPLGALRCADVLFWGGAKVQNAENPLPNQTPQTIKDGFKN